MLFRFFANAAAIGVATWLVDGIIIRGATVEERVITLLVVAAIFGFVNSVVKPLFKFAAAPLILVTLGLMLIVVNAGLFLLTSWISGLLGVGWKVEGFWPALWGGIIASIVSFILNAFFKPKEQVHK